MTAVRGQKVERWILKAALIGRRWTLVDLARETGLAYGTVRNVAAGFHPAWPAKAASIIQRKQILPNLRTCIPIARASRRNNSLVCAVDVKKRALTRARSCHGIGRLFLGRRTLISAVVRWRSHLSILVGRRAAIALVRALLSGTAALVRTFARRWTLRA